MSAYKRRKQSKRFAAAWDKTQFVDRRPVGQSAMVRAIRGERRIVFHNGTPVGESRKYSPSLIIHLLKAHLPERYRFTSRRATHEFQSSGYDAWLRLRNLDPLTQDRERPRWAMRFLDLLREAGSVDDACAVVGVRSSTAYRLRTRAPIFAATWDEIIGEWRYELEETALDFATHGWREQFFRNGKLLERHRYSAALAIFMLKALVYPNTR